MNTIIFLETSSEQITLFSSNSHVAANPKRSALSSHIFRWLSPYALDVAV